MDTSTMFRLVQRVKGGGVMGKEREKMALNKELLKVQEDSWDFL